MRFYKITYHKYKIESLKYDGTESIQIESVDETKALTQFLFSKKQNGEIVVVKTMEHISE